MAIAILIALGNWQMARLEWKEKLIAAAEARAGAPPTALADLDLGAGPADLEYRSVTATGTFDHSREAFLFAHKSGEGAGFILITPLILSDGSAVLVERGFVPQRLKSRDTRPSGEGEGEVTVTGLARTEEQGGWLTPAPDLSARVWYARDPLAMAEVLGVDAPPITIASQAAARPGEYPAGGHTRLTFRNDHLSYAMTWYLLAGVLVAVYLAYHLAVGRLRLGSGNS